MQLLEWWPSRGRCERGCQDGASSPPSALSSNPGGKHGQKAFKVPLTHAGRSSQEGTIILPNNAYLRLLLCWAWPRCTVMIFMLHSKARWCTTTNSHRGTQRYVRGALACNVPRGVQHSACQLQLVPLAATGQTVKGRWQQLYPTVHVRDSPLPRSHLSAFWVVTGWDLTGQDFASIVLDTAEGSTAMCPRVTLHRYTELTDGTRRAQSTFCCTLPPDAARTAAAACAQGIHHHQYCMCRCNLWCCSCSHGLPGQLTVHNTESPVLLRGQLRLLMPWWRPAASQGDCWY